MSPDRGEHDERCEAEFVPGAGLWTDCECLRRARADQGEATVLRHVGGASPDTRRPWFARLYYAAGVTKPGRKLPSGRRHRIPVGGQLAIAVTNATRDGLQVDIDAGIERDDIGLIEWGGGA